MIYFSIDLETTGVDWNKNNIIEFSAIMEDTNNQLSFDDIPKYSVLVSQPDDKYTGSAFALAMHKEIFTELSKSPEKRTETVVPYYQLGMHFNIWLRKTLNLPIDDISGYDIPTSIIVAGKNFGTFDKNFLDNNPQFNDYIKINRRILDPAILYFNHFADNQLPDLETCKKRAGIQDSAVLHRGLKDAWDVITVLRGKMYPKLTN